MNRYTSMKTQRGFNLLEVMMAVAIFAIGMLALASLQGSLTRSSTDAKMRTMAANIAERTIETMRTFNSLDFNQDPAAGVGCDFGAPGDSVSSECGFGDIISVDGAVAGPIYEQVSSGDAVGFFRTINVTDYYFDPAAAGSFTAIAPDGVVSPDFKLVDVCVAWGDAALCPLGVAESAADYASDLDTHTGNITVSAIVSSATTGGRLAIFTQDQDENLIPPVAYSPGENPDVIPLGLGGDRVKESRTPIPKIFRSYLETRFDVITYSQSTNTFVRREEFVAIACECTLRAPGAVEGRRPILWAGDEYLEPEFVVKAYGERLSGVKQSPFCDLCCRDHHDGGTGENDPSDLGARLYNPFRDPLEYRADGDHKHYKRQRSVPGATLMEEAQYGDDYVEACRLVRKDGFFRVAQDFRMEGLNAFPEDYLTNDGQVAEYGAYVIGEVKDHVSGGSFSDPARFYEGTCPEGSATLATAHTCLPRGESPSQQLRSRAVYIDYITEDLRKVMDCVSGGAAPEDCSSGDVELDKNPGAGLLELFSFFDVQTTFLNDWRETPIDYVATVTNEPLETDNLHSRGRADQVSGMSGTATAYASGHRGVPGITATDPIDNRYLLESMTDHLVLTIGSGGESVVAGVPVSGQIVSYVPGLQAANVSLTPTGAVCNFTNPEFTCVRPNAGFGGSAWMSITINQPTWGNVLVCSNSDTLLVDNAFPTAYEDVFIPSDVDGDGFIFDGEGTWVTQAVAWEIRVDLSAAAGGGYVLWLARGSC